MGLTGFNPEQISNSIREVKGAYDELVRVLGTSVQTNFVNEMANYWACNEAQTFFTRSFKPAIDELLNSSFNTFRSVIESMNSAATVWARQTDSQWGAISFDGEQKTIDVSAIKENINGVRGVDEVQATNTASKLSGISQSAVSALTSAQNAVQNCGFVGREQSQSLINSLGVIKNNIGSATDMLTNATKTAISNTVDAYGSIASNVETAFTA